MHTLNKNEMDSKQEVVSTVVSPISGMGIDFVRDDKEHPFPMDQSTPFNYLGQAMTLSYHVT